MEAPLLPPHRDLSGLNLFIIWQNKRPRRITLDEITGYVLKDIPEHANNTAAIAAGLSNGRLYSLPYDAATDTFHVAIVRSTGLTTEDDQFLTTEDDVTITT